ncbi:MAG: RNA-binding S4 domain-containing protein [Deltaproteobacteria bacterium]
MAGEKPGKEALVPVAASSQRLDKWLWCARLAKTRTQAAALVLAGKIRVNRIKTDKPAHLVKAGDVVTASLGPRVRVLAVKAVGDRRGAPEVARLLFDDLTAPAEAKVIKEPRAAEVARREPGAGRPTKRDRRLLDRLKGDT